MLEEKSQQGAFEPGQRVYDLSGEEAVYVAAVGSEHIVKPVCEVDGYEETYEREGRPTTWPEVFAEPPRAKRDQEIAAAEERVRSLQLEQNELRRNVIDLRAELEQFEQYNQLRAFLEGRITHVALLANGYGNGGPRVMPFKQFLEETSGEGYRDPRIMSLRVGRDGSAKWVRESTDAFYEPVLCTSEEEANEVARAVLRKAIKGYSTHNVWENGWLAAACRQFGVDAPEVFEADRRFRTHRCEERVAEAEQSLRREQERLDAAKVALAQLEEGGEHGHD